MRASAPGIATRPQARRLVVSSPYASFSIGTPMMTLSAPLQGRVEGVIAADLKLDKFSDFVNAQRPGEHGAAILFDASGALIAHPEFARLMDYAMTHPAHPRAAQNHRAQGPLISAVMRGWDHSDRYEGSTPRRRRAALLFSSDRNSHSAGNMMATFCCLRRKMIF